MRSTRNKSSNLAHLRTVFAGEFAERDAFSSGARYASPDPDKVSGPAMSEIAWEVGYEGAAYTTIERFEPLAASFGVDLRKQYDSGALART